jgi:hypothetical protein
MEQIKSVSFNEYYEFYLRQIELAEKGKPINNPDDWVKFDCNRVDYAGDEILGNKILKLLPYIGMVDVL